MDETPTSEWIISRDWRVIAGPCRATCFAYAVFDYMPLDMKLVIDRSPESGAVIGHHFFVNDREMGMSNDTRNKIFSKLFAEDD